MSSIETSDIPVFHVLVINSSVMLAGIQFCHTGLLPHGRSTAPSTLLDTALPFLFLRTGSCAVQERGEREKQEGPVARSNKVWGDCSTSISNRWKTLCRPSPARTLPMPARNERELTAAYKPTELASPSPKPSKQRKRCPCK